MPLYTYVMNHNGQTKVHQTRKSNFKGWLGEIILSSFPQITFTENGRTSTMNWNAVPVPDMIRTWRLVNTTSKGELVVYIIETRD
jgi:hypothetical protein